MAKRTLNPYRLEAVIRVEEPCDTDHRIELQERESDCRVIKVHLTLLELFDERCGERIDIDFQADGQRGLWAQAGTDTSKFCSLDRLMEFKRISPESLVVEGGESKHLPTLIKQINCVVEICFVRP